MRHLFLVLMLAVGGTASAQETPDAEEAPADETSESGPARAWDPLDPALAAELSASERLASKAEEAFAGGDFERAIALLKEAHAVDGNPNMLYNIARVYEEMGELESALDYYRRFVVAPNVDLDYRREALQSSETLEQTIAAQAAAEREAQEARLVETQQDRAPAPIVRPAPFPTTSPMRPLGYTLAAVGGVTALAGVVVGITALQRKKQFEEAGSLAERRYAGGIARDLATAADALYISGGVLILTGLVTAVASPRRERPLTSSDVAVSIRADGVGAAWTVRF